MVDVNRNLIYTRATIPSKKTVSENKAKITECVEIKYP